MKAIALAIAVASAGLAQSSPPQSSSDAACGPGKARFKVVRDKTQHPLPDPQSGRAILYVIGANNLPLGNMALGVDGSWVGAVDNGTYFSLPIDAGPHRLCARLSGHAFVMFVPLPVHSVALYDLDAKPGETYYISAQPAPNVGLKFALVDADEGRRLLESAKFSTSSQR